jgi:putative transposase
VLYLYVIIDILSRYVVGWLVAEHEREEQARAFIEKTMERRCVDPTRLTLHADRGSSMRSMTVSVWPKWTVAGVRRARPAW